MAEIEKSMSKSKSGLTVKEHSHIISRSKGTEDKMSEKSQKK